MQKFFLLLITCLLFGQACSHNTVKNDNQSPALSVKKYEGGSLISSEGISLNLYLSGKRIEFADMEFCGSTGKMKVVIVPKSINEFILQFESSDFTRNSDGNIIDVSEYKNYGWGYVKENKAEWTTGEIKMESLQSCFDEFIRLKNQLTQVEP